MSNPTESSQSLPTNMPVLAVLGLSDPADGDWVRLRGLQYSSLAANTVARLLAHGIAATGTRARLEAAAAAMQADAREVRHWCESFEFIQMLRLRVQIGLPHSPAEANTAHPNRIDIDTLSDIDRRVLKDALGAARSLQQRMALDYLR